EMAKGKTLEEAMKITRKDVADSLDGLPPVKMHCSNLAADGLHAAIEDYLSKKGKTEGQTAGKTEGEAEEKSGEQKD
ncbi:MAG TPA: hypothetical protein HA257_05470, partial [Candidatus Methanoperedenaceae archaeon]|nr:hypothetical protein [Candidatus Methanoperedenaceae archaeon]